MFNWLVNFIKKFILGETDLNNNGIPDNTEILKLIQSKIDKKKEKENKKLLKKLLR